jgi:hypothetical protein
MLSGLSGAPGMFRRACGSIAMQHFTLQPVPGIAPLCFARHLA